MCENDVVICPYVHLLCKSVHVRQSLQVQQKEDKRVRAAQLQEVQAQAALLREVRGVFVCIMHTHVHTHTRTHTHPATFHSRNCTHAYIPHDMFDLPRWVTRAWKVERREWGVHANQ